MLTDCIEKEDEKKLKKKRVKQDEELQKKHLPEMSQESKASKRKR